MSDVVLDPPPAAPEAEARPAPPKRRGLAGWVSSLAKFVTGFALGLLLLTGALVAFLDTGPGHRFIVDRIAAMTPASGLRVRIGRIEGSIWGRTLLKDVRVYDPDGLFAELPEVEMDWRPISFLFNRLLIHELESDLVILHRLPDLIEPEEPGPVLPEYDVHVGRLDVRQLRIGERVTGRERIGSLSGEAEIRRGRALIGLSAEIRDGGDRLRLRLDSEPDRDRFDLEARIRAPADSVVGAMLGTRRPVSLDVTGDGGWTRWTGTARLDISGRRTADLALAMNEGRFRIGGWAAPAPFLRGRKQRLTAPRVLVDAAGTFADRRIDGRLSLRSPSLRVESRGAVDLGRGRYDGVEIAAEVLRPAAVFLNMTGRQVRMTALVDGRFGRADFVYRLTAPRIAFDDTGFEEVEATGRGRLTRSPVTGSMRVSARRVTGVGDVAGAILANLRLEGYLQLTPRQLTGERLALSSDRLRGQAGLAVDLRTGFYVVVANPGMQAYPIPGFGLVDVQSTLRAVPGPGGRGTLVTGDARSQVRRLDNRFLAWVSGGLPRLETALSRGPDGIVHFSNLRIAAPKLTLAAAGFRRRDGTFSLEAAGRHGDYGPLRVNLEGRLERPQLAVRLDRPLDTLGLADVLLNLEPNEAGFAWRAEGRSTLGPFTGAGAILLPSGQPALIQVAALNVSGTRASGALRSDPGGFTGRLDVAGGGLSGRLLFSPLGANQRIAVNLAASEARFVGPPPILVRRGTIEGVVVLDPAGTSVEGRVVARGLSRGRLSIAGLDATASLRGGVGRIGGRITGSRGRDFALNLAADVAPGRYRITGSGTLDRRPLELVGPAELTSTPDGWRLAPARFRFAGGSASLAGLFGDRTEIEFAARGDAVDGARHLLSAARARRHRVGHAVLPFGCRRRAADRRGQSARPRPHPRRPRAVVAADGHRPQRPIGRRQCGAAGGGGQRRTHDRPGAGADLADRRFRNPARPAVAGADAGADPL